MKNTFTRLLTVQTSLVALASVMFAGCSKSGTASVTLAPEQVPTVMSQAFKQSSGETKELVNECVTAVENKQACEAFAKLEQLTRQSNLTPEQRSTAALAMVATFKQLRAAAASGDPAATAVMRQYLSTR
jgi:outer membrane PBP1 activator LpoA protein